jgi:hypothetical protein
VHVYTPLIITVPELVARFKHFVTHPAINLFLSTIICHFIPMNDLRLFFCNLVDLAEALELFPAFTNHSNPRSKCTFMLITSARRYLAFWVSIIWHSGFLCVYAL